MKVLRTQYSFIDAKTLNEKLDEERESHIVDQIMNAINIRDWITRQEKHKVLVDIQMLRTNWIFRGTENGSKNDFLQLIDTLDNVEDESLYTTEFVEALI